MHAYYDSTNMGANSFYNNVHGYSTAVMQVCGSHMGDSG